MQKINKLVAAGWTIERWCHGTRYAIMTRPNARRIVVDQYWHTTWISIQQD